MAYDEKLAARVRKALSRTRGVMETPMFGGLAFMLDGKMFCGILRDELLVRVGAEHHGEALARPHARTMDFTGRPMKGYVLVAPSGTRDGRALAGWIERGRAFVARSLLPASRSRSAPRSRSTRHSLSPGKRGRGRA